MTDLNKYEFSKKENIVFYILIAILGIILSILFYRNVLFCVIILPFVKTIKSYLIEKIIERRKSAFLCEFRDGLFMISTAIGSGRSMKDAIGESIPGLEDIYGSKSILKKEFALAYERMEKGGENDVDVLMELAKSSSLEDVVDFVGIYSICKTTGASLIIALNKAASVIIDKMTIEKEIRELVWRKECEGLIIFIMPVIVILFLNLCAPDYIAPLYESIAGRIIMTIAVATEIIIFGVVQKIVRVEI